MKNKILTNTIVVAILAMICCILWGSAFPCIKIGYKLLHIDGNDEYSQILFAGVRFALAGVLVIVFGSFCVRKVLYPGKREFGRVVLLCMSQTVFQYVFFYLGLAHTTGVKASIIIGSNVFIAIFAACFIFKQERFNACKLAGCIVGFAGVILINVYGAGINMGFTWNGEGFIFLAAASYAVSSALMKIYSQESNPVMLSGYQFLVGGILMMIAGLTGGGSIAICNMEQSGMILYLALISAVAYSIWSILLKYNPVSKVSVFGFMNPVCGVILSAIILGEGGAAFGISSVISLVLVSIGIIIVNISHKFVAEIHKK